MNVLTRMVLLLTFLSPSAFAEWDLSSEDSNINFISVKSPSIGEVHNFKQVTGVINDSGQVDLSINLDSVETNIGIRNDRIKEMLFETDKFLTAKITGFVDMEKAINLKVGDTYIDDVKLTLSLHGMAHQVTNTVRVTKLSEERIMVASNAPLILNASDFGLVEGIEKLRDVAKLPAIESVIPVTFSLIFE
jgi:polyisoprenoid-binding protein YceI